MIFAFLIGFASCKSGTEFDGFADHSYNNLSGSIAINQDSLGMDPFLAEKYFDISAKEHRLLLHARKNNLLTINGVALPESDNPLRDSFPVSIQKIMFDCSYNNYFYGYPFAIKTTAGTLVSVEKRTSETTTNSFSDNFILTSASDSNWTSTDYFKFAPFGLTWNGSRTLIGNTPDGKIVMKGRGLLVSDGNFQSWKHYPYAFQNLVNSGKTYKDYGPSITYSSKFGLFFGTGQSSHDTASTTAPIELSTLFSVDPDQGTVKIAKSRWMPKILSDTTLVYLALLEFPVFYSVENTDLSAHQGDIIGFGISNAKIYQFVYNYKPGDTFDSIRFKIALTNINKYGKGYGSKIRQSPIGIDYNPVTKRFEVMHAAPYTLDLWSISTDDLLSNKVDRLKVANWTLEATLLNRQGSVREQGLYPVSSIIDVTKNTQTVYFQAGEEYPARSGIFVLTRTLETPKLSQFMAAYRAYLAATLY
jgi:hypothetical protein